MSAWLACLDRFLARKPFDSIFYAPACSMLTTCSLAPLAHLAPLPLCALPSSCLPSAICYLPKGSCQRSTARSSSRNAATAAGRRSRETPAHRPAAPRAGDTHGACPEPAEGPMPTTTMLTASGFTLACLLFHRLRSHGPFAPPQSVRQ